MATSLFIALVMICYCPGNSAVAKISLGDWQPLLCDYFSAKLLKRNPQDLLLHVAWNGWKIQAAERLSLVADSCLHLYTHVSKVQSMPSISDYEMKSSLAFCFDKEVFSDKFDKTTYLLIAQYVSCGDKDWPVATAKKTGTGHSFKVKITKIT